MTVPCAITPSILAADFGILQAEFDSVATADFIQVDVMDGHFVPNLSFGAPVIECIQTSVPLDIHLMVRNPEDRIEEFLRLGVHTITFHYEAIDMLDTAMAIIAAIRDGGARAGLAINPKTPVSAIEQLISEVDMVLVMSVEPGFSGQAFIPAVLEKVRAIRSMHPTIPIQMDGGITLQNCVACKQAGATNLVVGSTVFRASNRADIISQLKAA
jgi:ribulose-phosphate 3-epimerase